MEPVGRWRGSVVNADFYVEFQSEDLPDDSALRAEAERDLRSLADEAHDMVGASVAIERLGHGETPYLYRARVVAYVRPENIAAVERADSVRGALKGALAAIERQVRDKREKLGKPWEQPQG